MKLYLFQSGNLEMLSSDLINDTGADEKISIPVSFNLIEHSKGLILFDGGNALEVAIDPKKHWGNVADILNPAMQKKDFVVNQLKKIGVEPKDIKYVVQSHLHLDHSGAIGYFPNAKYIVQKKELDFALNPNCNQKSFYIKKDLNRQAEWLELNGSEEDYFDLFGDGKIKIIFTPGHTPGHQSLLLELDNAGKTVLTGDAVHLCRVLDENILPAEGLCYCTKEYRKTVSKLRDMKKSGIKIIVGHDLKSWNYIKVVNQLL